MSKKLYPFRVPHFLAIFGARDEPRSSGMPMPASPASATNRRVETREPIEIIMACEAGRISVGDGRYWARTSDPQLVELVLSQLS